MPCDSLVGYIYVRTRSLILTVSWSLLKYAEPTFMNKHIPSMFHNLSRPVFAGAVLVLSLFASFDLCAETGKEIAAYAGQLDKIERSLKKRHISHDSFAKWLSQISELRSAAMHCVEKTEVELQKLTENITSLGEKTRKEPQEVARKRVSLSKEKQQLDNSLSRCKLIILRSDEFAQKITERQKKILAQRLLAKGPGFYPFKREWSATGHLVEYHAGFYCPT